MIKFLHGKALSQQIAQTLAGRRQKIAVAFIGRGAAGRLGLGKGSQAKVVCDLWSGACNPEAIHELIKVGAIVKRRDRLHAKVYLGDKSAVVCSANASTNGFAEVPLEQDFGFEAGLMTDDLRTLGSIETWFDAQFDSSDDITPADIKKAEALWLRRPRRPAFSSDADTLRSVLTRAITVPEAFPGLGFVFTNTSSSKKDRDKALRDAKRCLPTQARELTPQLNAFHDWDESDVLDWPMTFLAFHRTGGDGKLYLNANRFVARNESRGDVFAKADWSRISGKQLNGARKPAVLAANRAIAIEILRTFEGGRVFPTATHLAAYYEQFIGRKGKAFFKA